MNQLCDTGCGTAAYLAIENKTLTLATGVFVNWEMNPIFYIFLCVYIYICLNAEADRLSTCLHCCCVCSTQARYARVQAV